MKSIKNCPVCENNNFDKLISTIDYSTSKEFFDIVSCETCGFTITNPRPNRDEISNYYKSEKYISHTNNREGLFNKIYQTVRVYTVRKKRILLERISDKRNHLDIGCGTGEFLNECKKHGFSVSGVEPSETAKANAIKNYNLKIYDDLFSSALKNNSYDSISMWHVLEHVYDLNKTILKIKSLLKSKGRVIIAVPNHNSWDAKYYNKHWAAWDVPIHLWHFTRKSIESIFNKNGFKLIETKPMLFDSYYVSLLSEEYKTGKKNYIKSFFVASISNIKAKITNKEYSSLIYVFEKK